MAKKIVILNGSPRKNGNTSALTAEGAGFEESVYWYDRIERHIGWKSLGKILCGHVTQPGDADGKPELHEAYDLGKSIGLLSVALAIGPIFDRL